MLQIMNKNIPVQLKLARARQDSQHAWSCMYTVTVGGSTTCIIPNVIAAWIIILMNPSRDNLIFL